MKVFVKLWWETNVGVCYGSVDFCSFVIVVVEFLCVCVCVCVCGGRQMSVIVEVYLPLIEIVEFFFFFFVM